MEDGHQHDLDELQSPAIARRLRLAGFVVIALAVLAVAALWPRGDAPDLGMQPQRYVNAEITAVATGTCPGIEVIAPTDCRVVSVLLLSGADRGDRAGFTVLATQFNVPELEPGDEVVLLDSPAAPPEYRYSFIDFERSVPLVWLGVVFAGIVVIFGRWQGLRALCGLAASVLLLVMFLVPALLRDQPAVPVALAGAAAIACLALYLAHGFNTATTVALLGALSALLFIAVLAQMVVAIAQISGLADPDAQVLRVTAASLDLRGLLIAGIVIGALGSLDDVTVTQVSTVAALRRANPDLPRSALYREAIAVGRDHVASSVNTLVLAYAGAGLPLLIFFVQGNQPIARILGGELIAMEIVRTLVGSIGLILSVPATTALAAYALRGGEAGPAERDVAPRAEGNPAADDGRAPTWDDFSPMETDL